MTKTVIAAGALSLALLTTTFAPSAKADEGGKKTIITVRGGAVQIQGTVLEPGQYLLKLADSQAAQRILLLFNADETKLETIILANAAYRLEPTGDTRFTFTEAPAGEPLAISTGFIPGTITAYSSRCTRSVWQR